MAGKQLVCWGKIYNIINKNIQELSKISTSTSCSSIERQPILFTAGDCPAIYLIMSNYLETSAFQPSDWVEFGGQSNFKYR